MYKCTRLFVDLLLLFDEQSFVLHEVLRQLLEKPDSDKYIVECFFILIYNLFD